VTDSNLPQDGLSVVPSTFYSSDHPEEALSATPSGSPSNETHIGSFIGEMGPAVMNSLLVAPSAVLNGTEVFSAMQRFTADVPESETRRRDSRSLQVSGICFI
jgi:hypothetical protein